MIFATAITLVYICLMEGMLANMEQNALAMDSGQLQLHKAGYRRDPSLYDRLDDANAIVARLDEHGYRATPRLYGMALAANGSHSTGIQLRGIDLAHESQVTLIHKHLATGTWLAQDDPTGVVLGKRVASNLNVEVGSEVVVVGQASDGSMANALYKVRGVLKNVGDGVDRSGFFMLDTAFRELMVVPDGAHEIVVMYDGQTETLDEAKAEIVGLAPSAQVETWREIQPVLANLFDTSEGSLIFMMLLIYGAIGMVVFNAMLMAVFERIREFGVLKAIGVRPWQIATVIFIEATAQALMAAVLAAVVGLPVAYYLQVTGIDLTSIAGEFAFGGVAIEPIWYALITPKSVIEPIVFMVIITMIAVIYPAAKAALIRPVEAIRHQ